MEFIVKGTFWKTCFDYTKDVKERVYRLITEYESVQVDKSLLFISMLYKGKLSLSIIFVHILQEEGQKVLMTTASKLQDDIF